MKAEEGFSLIELIIVIVIISILASIALPSYMKYQNKSKVTSYALPIVKACAYDAAGECQERNINSTTTIDISTLKNCQNTIVPQGSLQINISGTITCDTNGYVSNGTITGNLNGITDYTAKCFFNNKGVICTVE